MTDWLLPLRKGNDNEECRYSLRSMVANAGMVEGLDRLVVVGDCPSWLEPDAFIQGNAHRSGPVNLYENLVTACHSGVLAEKVIVTNDDFFAVDKADPAAIVHRGPLSEHIRRLQPNTWWAASMRITAVELRRAGIYDAVSYELHRPLAVDTERLGSILSGAWKGHGFPPQFRSLYGNIAGIGGQRDRDVKVVSRRGEIAGPWFSTSDGAWRSGWSERLMGMFDVATIWEKDA